MIYALLGHQLFYEIENNESDGIEKIINVSNQKWKNAAEKFQELFENHKYKTNNK